MEIFWKTISNYNVSTWKIQVLIVLIAAVLTFRLYRRPSPFIKKAMMFFMVLLNLWVAVVYYFVYCSERPYYYIFAAFWIVMALIWCYELIRGRYKFERSYKYDKISYLLYAVPFIYPLVSLGRGMHFPMMTSPVMPCTVVVFSLGVLMSFSKKINLFLVLLLFHWALLGISKIYLYRISEDILLTICTVPAIFLYIREYIDSGVVVDSKPGVKAINLLLLGTCGIIGVVFTYIILKSFNIF